MLCAESCIISQYEWNCIDENSVCYKSNNISLSSIAPTISPTSAPTEKPTFEGTGVDTTIGYIITLVAGIGLVIIASIYLVITHKKDLKMYNQFVKNEINNSNTNKEPLNSTN